MKLVFLNLETTKSTILLHKDDDFW